MEGTISLGIYDRSGKLVRVLHQNAQLNDFTIGAAALVTRWDGKDDAGQGLPAASAHRAADAFLARPPTMRDRGVTHFVAIVTLNLLEVANEQHR